MDEKLLVFVLGAPGAGKGTQCDCIVKEYGWTHISAGDLLRAQVEAGTDAGKEAEKYLAAGTMVPASMIIGLLKGALEDAAHTKVLIDGFPRVLEQLAEFEAQVRPCDTALFYNVPEEAAHARLLQRGATSGRVDDNEATIRKRFAVFREESMQVITALQAEGRVAEIDAAASKEAVFAETRRVIERLEAQLAARTATGAAAAAMEAAATEAAAAAGGEGSSSTSESTAAAAGSSSPATAVAAGAAATATAAAAATALAHASATTAAPAAASATQPLSPSAAVAAALDGVGVLTAGPDEDTGGVPLSAAAPTTPRSALGSAVTSPRVSTDASGAAGSLQMDLSGIRTPVVICGPSGVGKGTLIGKLMAARPDAFGFSVSHTTRDPRPGEAHGTHYYFTDVATMSAQVAAGMFLEHADVHGNMYGTSLAAVARVSAGGKHCVLDIDVQGAAQVRKSALGPHCLFVFVAPPSLEELERRLRSRGTESEEKVQRRLANATAEIGKAQEPGLFQHVLVNDDLESAFAELQRVIAAKVPSLAASASAAGTPRATPGSTPPASPLPPATQQQQPAASPGAKAGAAATTTAAAAAAAAAGVAAVVGTAAATAAAPGGPPPPTANGTANGPASSSSTTAAAAAPSQPPATALPVPGAAPQGSTGSLLDFGFGATSGQHVAARGLPVRAYMDATVIPVLRDGLKALNAARPDDPLQFLADFLVARKAAAGDGAGGGSTAAARSVAAQPAH